MIDKNPNGDLPEIDKTAYLHPTAVIIGKVKIGKNVFIGPGVVIRGDEPKSSIIIHDNCNIQDKIIIHALSGTSVEIDKNSSLAHGCIIHGPCKIGYGCFIGFNAVIFNANLGDEVIVKHLAIVENVEITSRKLVPNGAVIDTKEKAEDLKSVTKELKIFSQKVVKVNLDLIKGYKNV